VGITKKSGSLGEGIFLSKEGPKKAAGGGFQPKKENLISRKKGRSKRYIYEKVRSPGKKTLFRPDEIVKLGKSGQKESAHLKRGAFVKKGAS